MAVSLLLAWYHPPFKGIKITASGELLFRLRWLPEDDTILLNWGVSLRSTSKTVPVGAGAVLLLMCLLHLLANAILFRIWHIYKFNGFVEVFLYHFFYFVERYIEKFSSSVNHV